MPTYEQLEAEIADAERLGDLEKLDELLAQVSGLGVGDINGASPNPDKAGETDDALASDKDDAEKAADNPAADQDSRPVVRAKDGVNEIPYSVLEAERLAAAQAREEIAQLQAQLDAARASGQQTGEAQGDLEDLQALNQILIEQLKEAGLAPKSTPGNFQLSDEAKQELKNEYGVVGSTIADLADAVTALRSRLTAEAPRAAVASSSSSEQAAPAGQGIQDIIQADPDLSRWVQDPEAWAVAQHVDAKLANSPGYAGKSFSERRAEVVAVTRQRLGESPAPRDTAAKADAIVNGLTKVPASLTDVGGESRETGKLDTEDLEKMSQVDIQAKLEALYSRGGQKAVDAFIDQAMRSS